MDDFERRRELRRQKREEMRLEAERNRMMQFLQKRLQAEQSSELLQVHFQPTQNDKLVLGTVAWIIPEILQQPLLQCLNKAVPEPGRTRRWIF